MMFGSFVYTRLKICLKTSIFELKMKTYYIKVKILIIWTLPINIFQINIVENMYTMFFG